MILLPNAVEDITKNEIHIPKQSPSQAFDAVTASFSRISQEFLVTYTTVLLLNCKEMSSSVLALNTTHT